MSLNTFAEEDALLEDALQTAMRAAGRKPGRFGGRYVARTFDKTIQQTFFVVLDDDDPDLYKDAMHIDILAHVSPARVYPIGRARQWITEEGKVNR